MDIAPPRPLRHGIAARDADGMAVASFVLGLPGLLVLNVFLGPLAIVLATLALARGTARRGRALLGLALGAADLLVLLVVTLQDHTLSWSMPG
ncbi:DUF4190 domain-containing protein [Streptomyces sp. NPDC050560]|uniref:DUF4190 domain-containing protein n=1 Tax=Streptomyces sp. NPDC050560 TaxID=3365630 RepID=UPI0037A881A6